MAVVIPIISEFDPKGLNRATSDFKRAEGGWGKAGAGMKAAFLPAVGALAGLGAVGVKFAKMASEDAAGASKMAKTFKNVTGATDEQVAATEEWISAQGKALGVADDDLRPALATLASATGDVTKAQELAALAMDVAASSGTDTATAAKAIAKATDGSFGSLKKLVPGIDDAALASKDFGAVMESTSKIVGGQAADAAGTAEGQQKRLTLSLAETSESIGGALLPVLDKLLPILQSMASWVADNTKLVLILAGAIAAIAAIVVVTNAAMAVYATVSALVEANQKRQTAGQWALNASMLANPVFLIVVGIVALIAAIVIAYKKSETFRRIVDGAFAAVKVAVGIFLNAVKAALAWIGANWKKILIFLTGPIGIAIALIVKHWDKIKEGVRTLLGWIRTAWQKVSGYLTKPFEVWWTVVSGIFEKVKGLIQGVLDLIGKIKIPHLPDLNPFSSSTNAALATGVGTYGATTMAAGSSSQTVNVFGAVDPEGTARGVSKLLSRHSSRQGRTANATRRRAW